MIVGGFIIKFSIDYAFTKYRFSYYRDKFSYATFTYNRLEEEQHFLFTQIEEFDLLESTERQRRSRFRVGDMEVSQYKKSDKQEIFIRTNTEVITLRELQADISHFLRNVFYQNLVKNQPR